MTPAEWMALTASTAAPGLVAAQLEVWRTEVLVRFRQRFGLKII